LNQLTLNREISSNNTSMLALLSALI